MTKDNATRAITERQALIDVVPILTRIEEGACGSYPYESCCRSCERLGEQALDLVLDALAEYPGQDRWSAAPADEEALGPTTGEDKTDTIP